MATNTRSDTLMGQLSSFSGSLADRERARLELLTGLIKKSLVDLYKAAGELPRIIGKGPIINIVLKSLWNSNPAPIAEYSMGASAVTGVVFKATRAITIYKLGLMKASAVTGTCYFGIYTEAGSLVASGSAVAVAGQGWLTADVSFTPVVGTYYCAAVWTPNTGSFNYVTITPTNIAAGASSSDGAISTLTAPDVFDTTSNPGRYTQGTPGLQFPTSRTPTNYGIDIIYA